MTRTIRNTASFIILVASTFSVHSQSSITPLLNPRKFSYGVHFGQMADDPWAAIEVTSPALFRNNLFVRLRYATTWRETFKEQTEQWTGFTTLGGALVYNFKFMERTRIYEEIGFTGIIPDPMLPDKKLLPAAYELTGAEIFILQNKKAAWCYQFGVGFTHAQGQAEKRETKPYYFNGFMFTNGFRFYWK
jgi:hypothetical protein